MSSPKRLCVRRQSPPSFTISGPQKRESFGDRICDDLCEDILQYLSLEDKLRLEGVSKQFQKTAFKRQYELTISAESSPGKEFENRLYKNNGIDLKALESLLKKCPNIRSIVFFYDNAVCINYNQLIRVITKYCHNLVEFKLPLSAMTVSAFKGLQKKLCSKLKLFSEVQTTHDLCRMNDFDNVEELLLGSIECDFEDILSLIKFKTLRKLNVTVPNKKEQLFHTFLRNHSSLKHLNLILRSGDTEVVNRLLADISNLKDLIHLNVCKQNFLTESGLKLKLFSDSFERIGTQCLSLKSFATNLDITSEDILSPDFLSTFTAFRGLKRLNLKLVLDINYDSDQFEADVSKIVLFEKFKDFPNLTHLTLTLDELDTFNESLLRHIYDYLPKLQYLKISNILAVEPKGVPQIADTLSRLSRLTTIRLEFNNELISQQIREEVSKKCPKIRVIDVKFPVFDENDE